MDLRTVKEVCACGRDIIGDVVAISSVSMYANLFVYISVTKMDK